MGDKVVEGATDNVAMAPEDKNYDGDYYAEKVYPCISNYNLAGEEKEEEDGDDCESSFISCQSQDLEIERNVYWQSQQSLLQEILDHHGSTGLKMKQEIARVIEIAREMSECACLSRKSSGCCKCLRQRVVNALCSKGFYATLSTSNWRHTSKLPGGTHEYIEVVANTQSIKKQVQFLIELNFRDEFKMAKACDEYIDLINKVPEVYIGKYDILNGIVRLLCDAAKRSAWEKRIHIGPWRKRSFMLKKWSASSLFDQPFSSNNALKMVSKPSNREVNTPLICRYVQFPSSVTAVKVI